MSSMSEVEDAISSLVSVDTHLYKFTIASASADRHDIIVPVCEAIDSAAQVFVDWRSVDASRTALSTYVWPAAIILAQYLCENPELWENKRVLELGCGCGLAGLTVIAASQWRPCKSITLTDCDRVSLQLVEKALGMRKEHDGFAPVMLQLCDWTQLARVFGQHKSSKPDYWESLAPEIAAISRGETEHIPSKLPQIIIGADVLFDSALFEPLLCAVSLLLHAAGPDASFVTVYQNRSDTTTFVHILDAFDLTMEELALPSSLPTCARFVHSLEGNSFTDVDIDTEPLHIYKITGYTFQVYTKAKLGP